MNGRGDVIVTALRFASVALCASGVVVACVRDAGVGALYVALGCFCMLWAIYLEVYSHRE